MTLGELIERYRHNKHGWTAIEDDAEDHVWWVVNKVSGTESVEDWYLLMNASVRSLMVLEATSPLEPRLRDEWPIALLEAAYGPDGPRAWGTLAAVCLAGEDDTWLLWSDIHFSDAADALYAMLHGEPLPEPAPQEPLDLGSLL